MAEARWADGDDYAEIRITRSELTKILACMYGYSFSLRAAHGSSRTAQLLQERATEFMTLREDLRDRWDDARRAFVRAQNHAAKECGRD